MNHALVIEAPEGRDSKTCLVLRVAARSPGDLFVHVIESV